MTGFRLERCYGCGDVVEVDRQWPAGALAVCGRCVVDGVLELGVDVDEVLERG